MKLRPEILMHPNIPKPLHGMAPRAILGADWWDIERKKAYASTDFHCAACGVHKNEAEYHRWLEAHELYAFNYPKGRMTFKEIVPLCHACHNFIHSGRMRALVNKGEMDKAKMILILARGEKLLKDSKLKRPKPPTKVAAWDQWRLILNGQEYKGKFKSFQEWMDFYK